MAIELAEDISCIFISEIELENRCVKFVTNINYKGVIIMMGIGILSIWLSYLTVLLQIMVYISAIFVSIKGVQALNIYIDKNKDFR